MEPGPRKVGAFRVKSRRSPLPAESGQEPTPIPGAAWEAVAVERLCELFQHKELEDLQGVHGLLPALKRIKGVPHPVFGRHVQQREERRNKGPGG